MSGVRGSGLVAFDRARGRLDGVGYRCTPTQPMGRPRRRMSHEHAPLQARFDGSVSE